MDFASELGTGAVHTNTLRSRMVCFYSMVSPSIPPLEPGEP
jgi:hypothetical protein